MKTYLHAFAMCQSMFCAIPCPWRIWDEQARGKMLLFLPAVGLEIGAVWVLLAELCRLLTLSAPVQALLLCACPLILSGFIHLDGFMDVTDAIGSWRDVERRREILKDSHVGSFAVIGLGLLLLSQFALFLGAPADTSPLILLFIPAVSRCCSALAVTALCPMSTSQYAAQRPSPCRIAVLLVMLAALLILALVFCRKQAAALIGCLLGYAAALRRAYRALEGMNGDISGYALTIAELCGAAVYTLL